MLEFRIPFKVFFGKTVCYPEPLEPIKYPAASYGVFSAFRAAGFASLRPKGRRIGLEEIEVLYFELESTNLS